LRIIIEPIGIIHSPYTTKKECPIQPLYASEVVGRVEVFKQYAAGLKDIETFSHIYLLYQFDRAGEIQMIRPTFLDDEPHGIFASRHPCRPNGIGMSIVKLIKREKNILEIEGVDVLDKTPLLDIKPYIPRVDVITGATEGWIASREWRPKPGGRE
jgi:tRNA-Thr(GGU) m(6)t(6)A37 methyltransferase TsaA